jgi:hypothetical protein
VQRPAWFKRLAVFIAFGMRRTGSFTWLGDQHVTFQDDATFTPVMFPLLASDPGGYS